MLLQFCPGLWYRWKMDMVSLGFYAVVCGTLSVAAPAFGNVPIRFGVGVLVGIAAAWGLPLIKSGLGLTY